jgi:hypothetical protein
MLTPKERLTEKNIKEMAPTLKIGMSIKEE